MIELLVVIAIIGILASVVLASLNTARSEGEDARDIANLNNARSQAELFYSTTGNGTYTNVCTTGANNISTLVAAGTCNSTATEWAAEVQLADGTTYYCVDSTGLAVEGAQSDVAGDATPNCDNDAADDA